jgi:hypothetical protein
MASPVPSNNTDVTLPLTPLSCPDGFSSCDSVSVGKEGYQNDYGYELGSPHGTKRRKISPTPQMLASLLEEESPPSSPVAPRLISVPSPPERTVDFITELFPSLMLSIHDDAYDSSIASGNKNDKENGIKLPAKLMPSKSYRPSKFFCTTLGKSASDNKMAT